jgi:hypothetical protein
VYKGLARREKNGDLTLYNEYHEQRDSIYDLEQELRPKKFKELDNDFFNRLGYDGFLKEVLEEFPKLKGKIEEVHVRRATTKQNEGSNIVDRGRKILIRLYPELFIEGATILNILRHELMHVSDMMDENFGYKVEEFNCSPMEERMINDRYRLFWDIFVDGRLVKEGRETIADKDGRRKEFDSFYIKLPKVTRDIIFDKIWCGDATITHDKMIEMAKDVDNLLVLAEGTEAKELDEVKEEAQASGPLPGTPCKLCGFPSYDWIEEIGDDEEIVNIIREDFPDWSIKDGICSRCSEHFKIRAGKW